MSVLIMNHEICCCNNRWCGSGRELEELELGYRMELNRFNSEMVHNWPESYFNDVFDDRIRDWVAISRLIMHAANKKLIQTAYEVIIEDWGA